jgi:hypothetical protein
MQTLTKIQEQMLDIVPGSQEFHSLIMQLEHMSEEGNIEAALYLTWVYSHQGALKEFSQRSFKLCESIAQKTGHPVALERMADLLLWGVGLEQDKAHSFKIYEMLAQRGMLPLTTLAYLHSKGIGTVADEVKASTQIILSAAQGETLAFMLLSHRYKVGLGVPINGLLSCAYAELAKLRKFPGSLQNKERLKECFPSINEKDIQLMSKKLIENIEALADKVDVLVQKISPQSQEFANAYLRTVAENINNLDLKDLSTNEEIRTAEIKSINDENRNVEVICHSPQIIKIKNFASFEECQYLIAQAQPMLETTQSQMRRNVGVEVDAFSGESAILSNRQTSPVNRVIQQRFAEVLNITVDKFEPISVLKYSVGHEYSLHTDAFDEKRIQNHKTKGDFGGQRITTNLIYLLPAIEGGNTHYQSIDYDVIGEVGTAVIHHNATEDNKPDPRSLHIGKAIKKGEKWLLRTATRQYPLYGSNKI